MNNRVFQRFRWQDKGQFTWDVRLLVSPIGFSGFVESPRISKSARVYVATQDTDSQMQSIARINDIRVDREIEDRGIGSMLMTKVIEECRRRGHKGIDGILSSVDRGHFQKLQHFYEKLGFSVVIYEKDSPTYGRPGVGKVEMFFDSETVSQ